MIEIFDDQGNSVATNHNWMDTQMVEIQGTGLAPTNDLESTVFVDLDAGSYTAVVSGANGTTGIGLVEACRIQ